MTIGQILLGIGIVGLLYFWGMDTTTAVPGIDFLGERIGGGKVHNIGLMQDRQIGMTISSILMATGIVVCVLFTLFGKKS